MSTSNNATAFPGGVLAPFWLGIWFGLLTGLLEAGHVAALIAAEKLPLFVVTATYPLAAPLINVCLFGGVGLLFSGLLRRRNAAGSLQPVVFVFALGFSAVLMRHVSERWLPLHFAAQLLLAAGLSVQLSRWIANRPEAFERVVRWSAPVLLLIAAGIVGRELYERKAAADALAADVKPPADAPNVIVVVLDTVRAKSLSLYGCEKPTSPNLDRLAAQGAAFDLAMSPAPWTLPSHASMFTGLSPEDLSTDWCIPLNDRRRTLAEELSARGYVTAGFVANTYYCGKHTGLQRGFQHYDDARLLSADALRNAALGRMLCRNSVAMRLFGWRLQWPGRKEAAEINREFLAWLNDRPADRPYFAFLNYFDAHDPYLDGAVSPHDPSCFVDHTRSDYTQEEFDALRESYERCVQSLDAQIGRLFDELERRGELQNTLVIVTSDHGEQFGEHGLVGHNNSLYRPATHVPLIVVHPGRVPAGVRVPNVVGLRDLAATVLDAVGGPAAGGSGESKLPGRSLARFWRADSSSPALSPDEPPVTTHITKGVNAPAWFPNAESGLKSVWTDRWHSIRRLSDGSEELFDVGNDPGEQHDLADDPHRRSSLPELRPDVSPQPTP